MKINSTFNDLLRAGKYFMFAALAACTMTACSSDDDDDDGGDSIGNFATPKYEEYAAKYIVNDNNSDYNSIELTASGNYIINYNDNAPMPSPAPKAETAKTVKVAGHEMTLPGMLAKTTATGTRGTRIYSEIVYGTYTKTGDDSYTLNGFGTVTVTRDSQGRATGLTITRSGGTPEAVQVNQESTYAGSARTNALCRTWDLKGYRTIQKVNGKTIMDITASTYMDLMKKMEEWAKKNDPDYDPSDWDFDEVTDDADDAEQMIFTKSGTYMVLYKDDELAISTWKWENEAAGILRYSWDADDFYNEYASGEVTTIFQGTTLLLGEQEVDEEDGYKYEFGVYYVVNEAK